MENKVGIFGPRTEKGTGKKLTKEEEAELKPDFFGLRPREVSSKEYERVQKVVEDRQKGLRMRF